MTTIALHRCQSHSTISSLAQLILSRETGISLFVFVEEVRCEQSKKESWRWTFQLEGAFSRRWPTIHILLNRGTVSVQSSLTSRYLTQTSFARSLARSHPKHRSTKNLHPWLGDSSKVESVKQVDKVMARAHGDALEDEPSYQNYLIVLGTWLTSEANSGVFCGSW